MANHIDYMVQRVGPDHVGIGIDISFDLGLDDHPTNEDRAFWWPASGRYNRTLVGGAGPEVLPEMVGGAGPEVLPEIEQLLRQRGYGASDIDKIFGLNFLRVAEATWQQ
jgi:membrane dipeptidase